VCGCRAAPIYRRPRRSDGLVPEGEPCAASEPTAAYQKIDNEDDQQNPASADPTAVTVARKVRECIPGNAPNARTLAGKVGRGWNFPASVILG
jgi:hypothetical protein